MPALRLRDAECSQRAGIRKPLHNRPFVADDRRVRFVWISRTFAAPNIPRPFGLRVGPPEDDFGKLARLTICIV